MGVTVALSGAMAWLAGSAEGLFPTIGAKCVAVELFAAALPLGAAVFGARRWAIPLPSLRGAVVAASGALVGQAALHLTCPVREAAMHLAIFHVGGVVLAASMGALVSRIAVPVEVR